MPAAQGLRLATTVNLLEKCQAGTAVFADFCTHFKFVIESGWLFEINLD